MVTCHRDLHPENVLVIHDGTTIRTTRRHRLGRSWPGRPEPGTRRVLLDWFFDDDTLDIRAVRDVLVAYRATGTPGRIAHDAFGLAISSRLDFLYRQVGIALDAAAAAPSHRAVREIDEALRILPTPTVLTLLAELDSSLG